ncbi:Plastid lipid-associated protein 2, chloroplastic [Galdieria sulphuraria]|nr:Plastid lipid-associated protein 2, chloroplastic [Galdieria sulphuraria]
MLRKSFSFFSVYLQYSSCKSPLQKKVERTLWRSFLSTYQRRLFAVAPPVDVLRLSSQNRKPCSLGLWNLKSTYSTHGEGKEGNVPYSGDGKEEPQSSSDASYKGTDKESSNNGFSKAGSDRGQNASHKQRLAIEELASSLETLNPTPNPVEATQMDGWWYLSYVSEKFYATNALLAAASITPLVSVGQVRQQISIASGELTNEVDLILFPNITGTLVTKARINPLDGERLQVSNETTTIRGKSIGEQFDLGSLKLDIPVDELIRRLKGTSPESFLDTYYLDEDLRISRTQGGRLFVFTRFAED